jgi:hypothetical protein
LQTNPRRWLAAGRRWAGAPRPARWVVAALLIACLQLVVSGAMSPAQATGDKSWDGYHWRITAHPVPVTFVNSLGTGFRHQGAQRRALADWDASPAVALRMGAGENTPALRQECPAIMGEVRICNADYGPTWFGDTELTVAGDHILGGSIRINDHWGTGASYRRFVVCHEVGHALGLGHHGGNSCLNGGQHPGKGYLAELATLYGGPREP